MFANRLRRPAEVAGGNCVDDGGVLAMRPGDVGHAPTERAVESVGKRFVAFQHIEEALVGAPAAKDGVKGLVGSSRPSGGRRLQAGIEIPERRGILPQSVIRRFYRQRLQAAEDRIELADGPPVSGGNDKTAMRPGNHQPFLFEAEQRFAERRPAYSKLIRERDFFQMFAALQSSGDDAVSDNIPNPIANSQIQSRHIHLYFVYNL